MNTIIEKIRAAVNRQRTHYSLNNPYDKKAIRVCNNILSTLGNLEKECKEKLTNPALQEQPVKIDIRKELASIDFMGVNDARDSETIARHFYELGCRRTAEKYDEIEYKRQRADVCEGLEEAVVDYFEGYWPGMETAEQCNTDLHFTPPAIMRLARHFAQWGAEHRGSSETPNDLEEAAVEYSAIGYSPFDDPYEKNQQFECSKFAFIAGAKWQMGKDLSSVNKSYESGVVFGMNAQKEQDEKELSEKIASAYQLGLADKEKQMMKEAVEGTVYANTTARWVEADVLRKDGFICGDKVKLIIVKED